MVKGEWLINDRIKDLKQAVELTMDDINRMKESIDRKFTEHERGLFASEGASAGEQWQALSPDYAKQKQRRYPGRKILVKTGRLRKSLTVKGDAEHIAYGYLQPRATVIVGSENPIGAYHAPGRLHNPNLPVRDPIAHTRAQWLVYLGLMRDHIVKYRIKRGVDHVRAGRMVSTMRGGEQAASGTAGV